MGRIIGDEVEIRAVVGGLVEKGKADRGFEIRLAEHSVAIIEAIAEKDLWIALIGGGDWRQKLDSPSRRKTEPIALGRMFCNENGAPRVLPTHSTAI
jgi:hypothetical protein